MITSLKRVAYVVRSCMYLLLFLGLPAEAAEQSYTFGVLNQRSPVLTATYWNPILEYVSNKTGIKLVMSMGKDVKETDEKTRQGEYDFVYTNHVARIQF